MKTYSDEQLEAYPPLFQLVARATRSRADLIRRLSGPMSQTALRLARSGFLVAAPEALSAIAEQLGAVAIERVDDPVAVVDPTIRLNSIAFLDVIFRHLPDQIDLDPFPEFIEWLRDSADVSEAARELMERIESDGRAEVLRAIADASTEARVTWGRIFR